MAAHWTRRVRPWAVVVAVTTVASLGLSVAGLPSPVLFGALVGGIVHALGAPDSPLEIAPLGFSIGQALVGATIGALVSLSTMLRLGHD